MYRGFILMLRYEIQTRGCICLKFINGVVVDSKIEKDKLLNSLII